MILSFSKTFFFFKKKVNENGDRFRDIEENLERGGRGGKQTREFRL